jgi:hypothetical protein
MLVALFCSLAAACMHPFQYFNSISYVDSTFNLCQVAV